MSDESQPPEIVTGIDSETAVGTRGTNVADAQYRVVSVQRSSAPSGSAGADWHMYSIARGDNVIRGYRRGDVASVTVDAEKIVSGLNERRNFGRSRVEMRPGRRPKSAPPRSNDDS